MATVAPQTSVPPDPGRLYTWADVVRIAEAARLAERIHAESEERRLLRVNAGFVREQMAAYQASPPPTPPTLRVLRGGRS